MSKKFLLLFMLLALHLVPQPAEALLKKGETLPDISGKSLAGESFSLGSLKGSPILLKIGTTWCPTCGTQSAAINELRGYLHDKGVKFVDIFVQESASTVKRYFNRNDLQLPDQTILDRGNIARQLNIYVIPRLILVDQNHKVFRDGDPLLGNSLKQQLELLLQAN
jgi:hypothetical protein